MTCKTIFKCNTLHIVKIKEVGYYTYYITLLLNTNNSRTLPQTSVVGPFI